MTIAVLGSPTRTNLLLADAWRGAGVDACVLWPREAPSLLRAGDAAILRLDVLPTLDGVEPGLEVAPALERAGVRVLNRPDALLATHDKLLTAARLAAAGIPHPATAHLEPGRTPMISFPCVLKPRFGSWGEDVFLCRTPAELARTCAAVERRPWWRRHGALLQELVGPIRRDLRVVVAGRRAVAAAERRAAPGEWRTNVSLGGKVFRGGLPQAAEALAVRAADALGTDLAGVDLLPLGSGWIVLELNGAVDFDARYALPGIDPYAAILESLALGGAPGTGRDGHGILGRRREAGMTKTVHGEPARAGDEILITGHSVGVASRTAVILEVLGEPGHERFRVRWEDGHESIFFPADDAVIRRPKRRAKAS